MDILTALIILMGKAKVGIYAKETLLVAIGMKDNRINMFIINNTKLLANMITELVKKFNSSVVSSLENIPLATSYTNSSSGGRGERSAVTPRQVYNMYIC